MRGTIRKLKNRKTTTWEVRVEEARQQFEAAVGDAEMYLRMGTVAHESGEYGKAIEDYDEAIRLDPQEANTYYNRGIAYGNLGQHERAIEDFDEAISLDPQFALAYHGRGVMYEGLGQQKLADRDFGKAKELGVE